MQEYANPPAFDQTTENDFLGGKIRITQPANGYRAGSDAVLLAAAVTPRPGEHILDAGCGVGTVGLCLLARFTDCRVTGIDIQPQFIALARENAARNEFSDRADFFINDIKIRSEFIEKNRFDQVVLNPPYFDGNTHPPSPQASRATARSELEDGATLEDWIGFAHGVLKRGGSLVMINRAERLGDILKAFDAKFGCVDIFPLWPRQGSPAKRLIVRARKDKRGPLRMLPGLLLHNEDNSFTPQAQAVMADASPLNLDTLE